MVLRCLFLLVLALGTCPQSWTWCTEEDKGKDCFINIRSAAPPQKQRGINFLDAKDSVKAAIAYTPLQTSLQLRVDPADVKHNTNLPQLHLEKDKIGVGTSQPECTLDVFGDKTPAELQLKGAATNAKDGAYSAALHLTDAATSKTWRVAHDVSGAEELSVGFSPNKNNPSLLKKILTLHADAPGECVAVDRHGYLVLSKTDNRRQETSGLILRKARGRTGTQQILANGDEVGAFSFQGFDGRQYTPLVDLSARVDGGAVKQGSIGARVALRTRKYGESELSERLVFDGNGQGIVTASAFDLRLDSSGALNVEAKEASFKCKALFYEPVEIRNDVVMTKSVSVKGKTLLSDTVVINEGTVMIEGEVESSGDLAANGKLTAKLGITSHGGLSVEGDTNVQSLDVSGDMKVSGHTTLQGNVDIAANALVNMEGVISITESGVSVSRKVTMPAAVVMDGPDPSNFSSGLIVEKEFKAVAVAEFHRDVLVTAGTVKIQSVEDRAFDVAGGVVVGQSLVVNQNISSAGYVCADTLIVRNAAKVENLQTNVLDVLDDLTVAGDVMVEKSVQINGTMSVQQPVTFVEDVMAHQSITVNGLSNFLAGISVGGSPNIRDASTPSEDTILVVQGDSFFNGSLQVNEGIAVDGMIHAQDGIQLGGFQFAEANGDFIIAVNESPIVSLSSVQASGLESSKDGDISLQAVDKYYVKVAAQKVVLESGGKSRLVLNSENVSSILSPAGVELQSKGAGLSLNNESITLAIGDATVFRLDKEVTEVRSAFASPSVHTDHVCSLQDDFCISVIGTGISLGGFEVTTSNDTTLHLNGTIETPSLVTDTLKTGTLEATGGILFGDKAIHSVAVKPFKERIVVDSNFIEIISSESTVSDYTLSLVPLLPAQGMSLYLTNRMNISFALHTTPLLTEIQPGKTIALVYDGTKWIESTPTRVSNAELSGIRELFLARDVDFGPHGVSLQSVTLREHAAEKEQLIGALPNGTLRPVDSITVTDGVLEVGGISGFVAHGGISMSGNILSNVAIVNGTLDGITRLDVRSSLSVALPVVEKSDRRLKADIRGLDKDECLEQVNKLQARTFRMKDDQDRRSQLGLVAQEVEPYIPEAVVHDGDSLGIQYTRLVPHLIEAVKSLTARVQALEHELETVKLHGLP